MSNEINKELVKLAANAIKSHKKLLITSGAGLSVDSGLPDYRSQEGLYKAYPPFRKLNVRFEDCANPNFFNDHPYKAWYFYGHRYLLYQKTKPHEGYHILNQIQKKYFDRNYFIYSSNVDGLFLKPELDFSEESIVEIHGSINYNQCFKCYEIIKSDLENFLTLKEEKGEVEQLPKCKKCRAMIRPNVLMFNDYEFIEDRYDTQMDKYKHFYEDLEDFVIIELGAGTQLPIIRNYGEKFLNSHRRCTLIRINPTDTWVFNKRNINFISKDNIEENKNFNNRENTCIGIEMKSLEALQLLSSFM